jgi:hypothetical protein
LTLFGKWQGGVDFGENAGTRDGGVNRDGHRWRRGTDSPNHSICVASPKVDKLSLGARYLTEENLEVVWAEFSSSG